MRRPLTDSNDELFSVISGLRDSLDFVQAPGFIRSVVLDDRSGLLEMLSYDCNTDTGSTLKNVWCNHSQRFIHEPALNARAIEQTFEQIGFDDRS